MLRRCTIRVAVGMWLTCFLAVHADDKDKILGQWVTKDGKARVEITCKGETYEGTIVWLKEPNYPDDDEEAGKPKHDRNNPEPSLRDRPIVGLCILSGFKYAGNGTWTGGSVYDPESGNTYQGKIRLDGSDRLMLRGFVGISLLGRTEVWERYNPGMPSDSTEGNAS